MKRPRSDYRNSCVRRGNSWTQPNGYCWHFACHMVSCHLRLKLSAWRTYFRVENVLINHTAQVQTENLCLLWSVWIQRFVNCVMCLGQLVEGAAQITVVLCCIVLTVHSHAMSRHCWELGRIAALVLTVFDDSGKHYNCCCCCWLLFKLHCLFLM